MKFKFIFMLLAAITCTEGEKILGIFHMPSYSHYQLGDRILKELARKGHEVTVITPYEEKVPVKNFKTVVLTGVAEKMEKEKSNIFSLVNVPAVLSLFVITLMTKTMTENTLNHPNVQKFIKTNEKFDVVIIEQFLNEAFEGFCYQSNATCVIFSPGGTGLWINSQFGNPGSPAYVPEVFASLKTEMNFFQRVYNTFMYMLEVLIFEFYSLPTQNKLLQKYFPGAPHISELHYNISLALLNSNPGLNSPVPLLPNMIEIGGFHVKNPKKLPKDLQEYLDSANDGAIFFSMGSNVKSNSMDPAKRDAILSAFAKFKNIKVLWKWEDENLPNKPENVKISKWLPQQDILAHPNVKLFISHGGFLSTTETVYHGVPVIGIPIFGDQRFNIINAENAGYAIKLEYNDLTEESLTLAINEMLSNPSYSETVKRKSKIMHDLPEKPLDKAMFWIEYLIRHKGAPHFRSAALSLNWYQYLLLDVLAFVVVVTIAVIYIFSILLKAMCGYRKCKKNVTQSKKKN